MAEKLSMTMKRNTITMNVSRDSFALLYNSIRTKHFNQSDFVVVRFNRCKYESVASVFTPIN